MKRIINIGLIGFGTVGKGVYNIVLQNGALIYGRTDVTLKIKSICDLHTDAVKKHTKDVIVTDRWQDIVDDPEIDTVVELIGGLEPAKTIVEAALSKGKNVVTANKKLLAEAGENILKLASGGNVKLGFEASVGGGIPCLAALKHGLVANNVESAMGILNGTTNYILTMMEESGLSFDAALKEAQAAGFAEADPTFDIEGYDTGHKIALIAMLAYNKNVDYKSIDIEGITKLSHHDIAFAKEMGYNIKLLGICKMTSDGLDIRVHPTLIRKNHPLASVKREFNAVMFNNDMTGPIILNGKGAGSLPTASAVVSDIVQIAVKDQIEESAIRMSGKASVIAAKKRCSRYYFRLETEDTVGILEKIAGTCSKHNISIASVVQKEGDGKTVPLIILTHSACEEDFQNMVAELNTFSFVTDKVVVIRIEDQE